MQKIDEASDCISHTTVLNCEPKWHPIKSCLEWNHATTWNHQKPLRKELNSMKTLPLDRDLESYIVGWFIGSLRNCLRNIIWSLNRARLWTKEALGKQHDMSPSHHSHHTIKIILPLKATHCGNSHQNYWTYSLLTFTVSSLYSWILHLLFREPSLSQ